MARQKGTPNKATVAVRDVFTAFVEANAEKAQALFDRVAARDPAKALDLLARIAEFGVPKLARTEFAGQGEGDAAARIVVKFVSAKDSQADDVATVNGAKDGRR